MTDCLFYYWVGPGYSHEVKLFIFYLMDRGISHGFLVLTNASYVFCPFFPGSKSHENW